MRQSPSFFARAFRSIVKAVTTLLAIQSAVGRASYYATTPGAARIQTSLEPTQVRNNLFLTQNMTHLICAQFALGHEPAPCHTKLDSHIRRLNKDGTFSFISQFKTEDSKAHLDYTEMCTTENVINGDDELLQQFQNCGSYRNMDYLLFSQKPQEESRTVPLSWLNEHIKTDTNNTRTRSRSY